MSQSTQRVDASAPASCRGCSITLTKIATLGAIDDDVLPSLLLGRGPATNSKGEFFVPSAGFDQIVVYSSSGKFIRTIGRKGDGPGEFRTVLSIASGANDSLFVLSISRVTVYSSSFALVRTVPLAFNTFGAFVGLPRGTFVLDAGTNNPLAQTLRFVSADGVATPGGPAVNVPPSPCPRCGSQIISSAGTPGQFWTAVPNSYHIERRNAAGDVLQVLQVTASPWYRPWARTRVVNREDPPPTILKSLNEDIEGRLWIVGDGPSPTWYPMPYVGDVGGTGRVALNSTAGSGVLDKERLDRIYTVVEVLDPKAARMIVSTMFTGRQLRLIAPGLLAEVREEATGLGVVDIFRAEIKRP